MTCLFQSARLLGERGIGPECGLTGLIAERLLIAWNCVGWAKWFTYRGVDHAKDRLVFGRAIGQNQGIPFPSAKSCAVMRSAELMMCKGVRNTSLARNVVPISTNLLLSFVAEHVLGLPRSH